MDQKQPIKRAFIFPGFRVGKLTGMGRDLAGAFPHCAGEVFRRADRVLDVDLSRRMFEGPEDELKLLENRLPAIFAFNMALMRVIKTRAKELGVWDSLKNSTAGFAGHSFGEYAALCSAGSIDFEQALKIMRDIGRSMDRDPLMQKGLMAVVLGGKGQVIASETAHRIAEEAAGKAAAETGEKKICAVVNDNAPNQIVLSGDAEAVLHVENIARSHGLFAIKFNRGVPAHSSLMRDSIEVLRGYIAELPLNPPSIPFISGCTARIENSLQDIRRILSENIGELVRWQDTIRFLADRGVTQLLECGEQLSPFVSSTDARISAVPLRTPEQIDGFLKSLVEPSAAVMEQARERAASGANLGLARAAAT